MIKKLTTDLKAKGPRSIALGHHTLVVGDSASGKSAVTQSVELGCSDRMTDFQGRRESSGRTVKGHVAGESGFHVTLEPEEEHRLMYRFVSSTIVKEGTSALIGLTRGLLGPALLVRLTEYEAFDKRSAEAGRELRELEKTRDRIESWDVGAEVRIAVGEKIIAQAKELDAAKTAADELQSQLWPDLHRAAQTLAGDAGVFIPKQLGKLSISTGTPQSPRCVLSLDDRVSLSGSEWNIALTALACALSTNDTDLVIPDDRAIDLKLLTQWLLVLDSAPCQILLTAITAPDKVGSWTVLQVGQALPKLPKRGASLRPTSTGSKAKSASRGGTLPGASKSKVSSRRVPRGAKSSMESES